ncbi:MAG: MerR family transcriptional regulator [Polynucleobacter sp.]
MNKLALVSSSDIEFETGFSSDLLRKWRQRYGFPPQEALTNGKAAYSRETINRLLLIKRLLENGLMPAQVVSRSLLELNRLQQAITNESPNSNPNESIKKLIERLNHMDQEGFLALLVKARSMGTLTEFVTTTVAPLLVSIGVAWSKGEIDIYHEHLCSSIVERYLHAELLLYKPKGHFPIILFATPPEEHHILGLLMAEVIFAEQGAQTINLGRSIPLNDLKLAAIAGRANIVALSFSHSMPIRRIKPILTHLRHILPKNVEVWVGGSGIKIKKRPQEGVRIFSGFEEAIVAIQEFAKINRDKK